MFETVKDFFFSLYGAFIVVVFWIGALYFGSLGYQFLTVWIVLFLVPIIYKLNQIDKENGRLQAVGDRITTERQVKAIDDYILMIKKKSKRQ